MAGREWGFWTREKLDILRRYLDAFTTACKGQREIIYLDLFSGEPENYDRLTRERVAGSPRIALETADPAFTRLRFFELERNADPLRQALAGEFADRDFTVTAGDCNDSIHGVLSDLSSVAWAPTFAFIDPNGTDVKWTTLEQLARFRVRSNNKVELWMLFPAGLLMRNLPKSKDPRPKDVEELTEAYGSDQWQVIYEMYRAGTLDGSSAREEYVNLLRWRLENVLGYTYTHQFDVRNEAGSSIYHLVFATCNGVGNKIMSHLYGRAAREFPAMRAEAQRLRQEHRDAEHGKVALFDSSHFETNRVSDEDLYEHRPPWPPPGTQEA